jgi:single-stranded DNA-binding protein
MSDLNQVQITARLTAEPRYLEKPTDKVVKKMTILLTACNYRARDSETGRPRDCATYIDVNCYGVLAEFARDNLHTGDPVFVTGRLRTSRWVGKTGQREKVVMDCDLLVKLNHVKVAKAEAKI